VGTPLIEIGDPADLEIIADLLSTDAVQVESGAPVNIEGWGGSPLNGKVARVDPAGFTKVSALGIEEQRVRSIIEISEPATAYARLGHDFRVSVRITIWSGNNILTIPTGSIFRSKNNWAVYKVENGKAKLQMVTIGRRTNQLVEVTEGLRDTDAVILHPSDRVSDGQSVTPRGA
jgi:HlyD family secretion protein